MRTFRKGRPPVERARRDVHLTILVSQEQKDLIKKASELLGLDASAWLRMLVMKEIVAMGLLREGE